MQNTDSNQSNFESTKENAYLGYLGYLNSYRPTCRGKKNEKAKLKDALLRCSRDAPSLWYSDHLQIEFEYGTLDKNKAIVRVSGQDLEALDFDESPYSGIDIAQLWGLPNNTLEVPLHPPLLETLKTRRLKIFAHEIQEQIKRHHAHTRTLYQMFELLMGDNPLDNGKFASDIPSELRVQISKLVLDNLNACCDYEDSLSHIYLQLIKAHIQKKYLLKAMFVNRSLKKKSRLLINSSSVPYPPNDGEYLFFPVGSRISPGPNLAPDAFNVQLYPDANPKPSNASDPETITKKQKTSRAGRIPAKASTAPRGVRKQPAVSSSPKVNVVHEIKSESIPQPPVVSSGSGISITPSESILVPPPPPPPPPQSVSFESSTTSTPSNKTFHTGTQNNIASFLYK